MAWAQPVTFVVGTMVTAARMNQDVRDNLLALDQHDHSGASGSGTRSLGAATGETVLYFAQAAAPAAPTGTITVLFASGTLFGHRSSGGAALMMTATGHTHGY